MADLLVDWSEPAVRDLSGLRAFLADENPEAARRIAAVLLEAARSLAHLPRRGRPGRAVGTRELVLPGLPWLLVYEVAGERVIILRVLHQARLWPSG